MKKILSTKYTDTAVSIAMLALRLGMGLLMIPHGYNKLVNFSEYAKTFSDPFHIGSALSLSLLIFAEFFCAIFIVAGLFTRITAFALFIAMSVAVIYAHKGEVFGDGEQAALYLSGYIAILLIGPGKISLDKVLGK